MNAFFCRLIPPRPSFATEMSEDEAGLMRQHAVYWQSAMDAGHAVVFGLVADPKGPYGIGVAQFERREQIETFTSNDPVIRAAVGFSYEIFPMPRATCRPRVLLSGRPEN
jgi:uncharacterized protein